MAYPISEYHRQNTTAEPVEYEIGTEIDTPFVAEEIVFFATQDTYVYFEKDTKPTLIPKEVYFEWYRRAGILRIQRVSTNGILHIWSEGHTRK